MKDEVPSDHSKKSNRLEKATLYPIEGFLPFSQSLIWKLNHQFYQEVGLEAWREGDVPYQLTSNSKVGKAYAEIIFGFLKDLAFQGKIDEKIYILELGAGHGKLAFHLFKHLDKLIKQIKINLPEYCYILSDIAEDNIAFYQSHPQFKEYIDSGRLDIAYFDMLTTQEISLRISGESISSQSLEQPIVVLANYFFDSIPAELFYYKSGKVFDCELSLESFSKTENLSTSDLLRNLKLTYNLEPHNPQYFEDPLFNKIVDQYKHLVKNSHVIFPSKGIEGLNRIMGFSKAGMMVVTMDKGFHEIHDLEGASAPKMMTHGSMSFSVNYHALGTHCTAKKGTVWFPSSSNFSVELVCLIYLPEAEVFTDTRLAFQRYVDDFGPDDYNILKKLAYQLRGDLTIPQILAYLRMANYDTSVFVNLFDRLKQLLSSITYNERHRILQAMHEVWEMYFSLNESYDLAFELGGIFYALGAYEDALSYFHRSEELFGSKPDTYYNKALSYYQLRQDDSFVQIVKEAKLKFPKFEKFEQLDALDLKAE